MEFGNVQRGMLGVEGAELNATMSKEFGVNQTEGFYVNKVTKNSGAEKSGLKSGDIIVKLDNQNITSFADLNSYINTKRPNDKVQVSFLRDEKLMTTSVTLSKNDIVKTDLKGIQIENIGAAEKKEFKIGYGVKITEIENPRLKRYADELSGAIILKVDNIKAVDVETVSKIMSNKDEEEGVQIELITNNGQMVRMII